MNGMVIDSWPYVIAAFAITWVVLLGYSIRLVLMTRRTREILSSSVPRA
jgi:CcmD family protein